MRARWVVLSMAIYMAVADAVATRADLALPTSCELTQDIMGTFTAGKATYFVHGTCRIGTSSTNWRAHVVYENERFTEDLSVQDGSQLLGTIRSISYIPCAADPWLSQTKCRAEVKRIITVPGHSVSLWLQAHFFPRYDQQNPFSATFNHARAPLLAKRDADLVADARRLRHSTQPVPLITPTILTPAANALFLSNTSVPIKIAPPQGMTVTSFNVRIESRNAQGGWTLVTNLPITIAEASSPSGYLGWGAPAPGKGAAMLAAPGTYRVSAQVSSPRPTGWSQPVEFVVTTPSKAIQKAPKMFGP